MSFQVYKKNQKDRNVLFNTGKKDSVYAELGHALEYILNLRIVIKKLTVSSKFFSQNGSRALRMYLKY